MPQGVALVTRRSVRATAGVLRRHVGRPVIALPQPQAWSAWLQDTQRRDATLGVSGCE